MSKNPPEFGYKWIRMRSKFLNQINKQMTFAVEDYRGHKHSNFKLTCVKVDQRVREVCEYQPDVEDQWSVMELGTGDKGDCEDFALTWWRELYRYHIPAHVVVGLLEDGRGHAVTVAESNGTVICFDIRRPSMKKINAWGFQPLYALDGRDSWIAGVPHE